MALVDGCDLLRNVMVSRTGDWSMLPQPPTRCPACDAWALSIVRADQDVHFTCEECNRCWRFELGYASEIDADVCSGPHGRQPQSP